MKQLNLWKSQQEFFSWGPSPIMYMGGVGSGKSFALVLKMLYLLDTYPGSRGLIARQRFNQLKKTTSATLWQLLPRDKVARRNDNEGSITLTNGSQLLLVHLDSADSLSNLKSLEINFAAVDQTEDVTAEAWDTLYERVGRWSGALRRGGWPIDWPYKNRLGQNIPPRYLFGNCYSPGYDHWITQRFWEHGTERDKYRAQGYKVVSGSTRDNLALSEEYVADRIAMGPEYVRRFVDATDWGAHEGRIFDIDAQSILEPTQEIVDRIRRTMRLHRVYDHGEASPSAMIWYATDQYHNIFVYREYMQAGLVVSEHRRNIYDLSKLDSPNGNVPPPYYSNLADPAIMSKNRGRTLTSKPTWSVADEFADRRVMDPETAIYFRKAENDEAMTINRVREYLRPDKRHANPLTGKRGAPRIYFLRRTAEYPYGCFETLVDIRSAKRKEVGVKPDGTKLFGDERDDKVRDHLLDCIRYLVGTRPALGPKAEAPPADPGTLRIDDYYKITAMENSRVAMRAKRDYRGSPYGY